MIILYYGIFWASSCVGDLYNKWYVAIRLLRTKLTKCTNMIRNVFVIKHLIKEPNRIVETKEIDESKIFIP